VMADRTWERGMHQLMEAKEGVPITAQKEPLARISYQRFFRRYVHLSGMTGTGQEVAGELGAVYGLPVVRVPTNRPSRRVTLPEEVYVTEDEKWRAIGLRVREVSASGRPVLLGTRSVAASERASAQLAELGLEHRVLNAKQDREEAEIIALAGGAGRITIATNMAGRGTDIKLGPDVMEAGGLHVILSERHDSKRIDRQLAGRCARQGDPGCFQPMLSLEDDILSIWGQRLRRLLCAALMRLEPARRARAGALAIRLAQWRAERSNSRVRKALLKMDQHIGKMLAFSGSQE
jgi:preprotein translocase subunit SecA